MTKNPVPQSLSLRFSGTLTAVTPIMITRPDQGARLLTTTVIRADMPTRAAVLPGETIKGILRSSSYSIAVDAARRIDPNLSTTLDRLQEQTKGGISFSAEARNLGSKSDLRAVQPILSLFGAATPKLTGRLRIDPAIARPVGGPDSSPGLDLPGGTRRDALLASPDLADLLSADEQAKWSRQATLVSAITTARARQKDAERLLYRTKSANVGIDLTSLETAAAAAKAEVAKLEADPDYTMAVQRPVPTKNAVPAGTVFDHRIELMNATPTEAGLVFAALDLWCQDPRIGGGATTGYGRLIGTYTLELLTGDGLTRDRHWTPIGTATLDGSGTAIISDHRTVTDAKAAWRAAEACILQDYQIFAS